MRTKLCILRLVGITVLVLYLGFAYGQSISKNAVQYVQLPPQIVIKEIPIEVIKEVPVIQVIIKEVPVEVIKEVSVVKEIEKPVELTDFSSLAELQALLDSYNEPIVLTANSQGVINLNNQCVTTAIQLKDYAESKGKYLGLQVLNYNKPISHMVNMAIIGDGIYFIEPSDKSVWLNSYRGDK